eukprot:SAG31_NODE_3757_length_3912_cov_2.865460_1_plen_85_part_00
MRVEGSWKNDGYVVVRGVFDAKRVSELRSIAEHCINQWKTCNPEDGKPKDPATQVNQTCMRRECGCNVISCSHSRSAFAFFDAS